MEILGSIYTEVSEKFQKGILKGGISRCIKAEKHDCGVVMAEVRQIGNIAEEKNLAIHRQAESMMWGGAVQH